MNSYSKLQLISFSWNAKNVTGLRESLVGDRIVKSVTTATNSTKFLLLLHLYNAIQSECPDFKYYKAKKSKIKKNYTIDHSF